MFGDEIENYLTKTGPQIILGLYSSFYYKIHVYSRGMIPEKNRLKRQRDFEIIMSEGMFVPSRFLAAKIWKIDLNKYPKRGYSSDDLKIGFSVGIKISKSAVVRNRLRRQMREVVRLALKEEKILPGYMVLFIAKPKMRGINYKEIERDILDVLVRGKIIA